MSTLIGMIVQFIEEIELFLSSSAGLEKGMLILRLHLKLEEQEKETDNTIINI